jgi:hypothetical protein
MHCTAGAAPWVIRNQQITSGLDTSSSSPSPLDRHQPSRRLRDPVTVAVRRMRRPVLQDRIQVRHVRARARLTYCSLCSATDPRCASCPEPPHGKSAAWTTPDVLMQRCAPVSGPQSTNANIQCLVGGHESRLHRPGPTPVDHAVEPGPQLFHRRLCADRTWPRFRPTAPASGASGGP